MYIRNYENRPEKKRLIRLSDGTVLAPQADLRGRNLSGMDLSFVDLYDAKLDGANFNDADLTGAKLSCAKFSAAKFRRAILTDANFAHSDLSGADFKDAIIGGANFSGASLEHAILDGATTVTEGYRLNSGTNFRSSHMSHASLASATIESGCFERSDLSDANMEGAHIYASHFEMCYFDRTNLKNSEISDCFLYACRLENADFSGARIYGCGLEDITEVPLLKGTELKYCFFTCNAYDLFEAVSAKDGGNMIDCVYDADFLLPPDLLARFVSELGLDPDDMGLPSDYLSPEYISRPYDVAIKNVKLVEGIIESLVLAVCDMTGAQRRKSPAETITRASVNSPELADHILGMTFEAIELCIKIIDEEE